MARAIAAGLLMVAPGDSPWSIAGEHVGDTRRGAELVRENAARELVPGAVLRAPPSWAVRPSGPGAWAAAMDDAAGLADVSEWDEDALSVLRGMALYWHIRPVEILGIFLQESGLDARATRGGYMGLISGSPSTMDSLMGWPRGTWFEVVQAKPIATQLQAIAAFWRQIEIRYLRSSYLARARAWGTSVAGLIYAGNFLPARLAAVADADAPLTSAGEVFYADNRGLDEDKNGSISVRDMARRVAKKALEVAATYPALIDSAVSGRTASPFVGALVVPGVIGPGTFRAGVPGSAGSGSPTQVAGVAALAGAGLAVLSPRYRLYGLALLGVGLVGGGAKS